MPQNLLEVVFSKKENVGLELDADGLGRVGLVHHVNTSFKGFFSIDHSN